MIKIAVIIVVYNGEKYLTPLFASLKENLSTSYQIKIFVLDNASTDNSINFLKSPFLDVELHRSPNNLGFAAGNNLIMQKALDQGFDYLYLLNQDTRVTASWLEPLIKKMETDKTIAAAQPKLFYYPETNIINSYGNIFHYLGFGFTSYNGINEGLIHNYSTDINYASGAAVVFRSAAIRKVGLFDPEFFMYHEDTDLSLKLKLSGFKIKLIPEAKVYHQYEFSRSLKKFYYIERNRYIILLKFYKLGTLILILPGLIFLEIGLLVKSILNGFFWQRIRAYGYFFNLINWKNILKERRSIQASRVITDRELLKQFSGQIEFQEIDSFFLKYIFNPILDLYKKLILLIIYW